MLKPLLKRIIQYSSTLSRCSFVNKVATIVLCFNKNVFGAQLKMDRFLIKKRKVGSIDEGDEGDEGESSEATVSEKRAVTNTQQMPENVEQEKHRQSNRKFHEEWENLYFVAEYNSRAVCLICRQDFTQFKKYSFDRHFKTTHSAIDEKFPASSKQRANEISRLKNELLSEQKVVKKFINTNELVTRASYEIAFEIAKHGKSYSDGEFHKRLMQSTIETLCENWDQKQKTMLLDNVKKLPLSHQTVSRRVNEIGGELEANLKLDLEHCAAFSIALDETTDIKDEAQLIFFVRYFIDDRTEEDILALVSLPERTTAEDIFKAFQTTVTRFNLNLKKLASICTDGAPAMIGIHNGFTALVKRHVAQHFENQHLITYHCIIHQENLCAKALQRNSNVVETVTQVCVLAIYVIYLFIKLFYDTHTYCF